MFEVRLTRGLGQSFGCRHLWLFCQRHHPTGEVVMMVQEGGGQVVDTSRSAARWAGAWGNENG